MHLDIKIQVSCHMKESIWGSITTILHPLTELKVKKFALTVNKLNLLTASFLQINHWNSELEGEMHLDIKIQVSNDKKQSSLGAIPPSTIGKQNIHLTQQIQKHIIL